MHEVFFFGFFALFIAVGYLDLPIANRKKILGWTMELDLTAAISCPWAEFDNPIRLCDQLMVMGDDKD